MLQSVFDFFYKPCVFMFEPNKESRIGKVKAVRDIFLCFFTVGSVIIPYLPTLVLYSDTDFKLIKVVKRFCPLS